ncbi:MAG: glycosyltransferase, partial [Candidatus Omnitrophica bacterium]|nr:glycosyltransferase [Candidatus Omnitrophota bacterium]
MKKKNGKKLNIAHLHWGFPPVIGGVETHLTILLPTLVELGHNVSLLTGSAEGAKIDDEYRGVKILRAPIMDLNWLVQRGLHGIEKEVVQVYSKFIDRQKPDILHAHNMHYFSR